MKALEITFTLETPTCLSSAPAQGNETQTLRYIPGSVVRGILATKCLQNNNGKPNSHFDQLFSETGLRFGNLTPLKGGSLVIPLSAYTCKRFSGFEADPQLPDGQFPHGVFNLLFEDLPGGRDIKRRCSKCQQPLSPHLKLFCYQEGSALKSVSQNITTHMRTSVGSSGSARAGFLFSQEELPAGSQFRGYIYGQKNDLERLMEQLNIAYQDTLIGFTGRRRSGKGEIKISSTPPAVETPHFFPWPNEDGEWVILTLISDSILVDRLLRPVTSLKTQGDLVACLGLPPQAKIEVKKSFVGTRTISGWSGIGQIFRPDDLALIAGSTFLLHIEGGASGVVRNWANRLLEEGIGLRRAEGFGRVTFSHPIHIRSTENQHGSRAQ